MVIGKNYGCQISEIPKPINIKFEMGDHVEDIIPQAQIQIPCKWVKDHMVLSFLLAKICSRSEPRNRFTRWMSVPGYCISKREKNC